jgi:hypothetical protein
MDVMPFALFLISILHPQQTMKNVIELYIPISNIEGKGARHWPRQALNIELDDILHSSCPFQLDLIPGLIIGLPFN